MMSHTVTWLYQVPLRQMGYATHYITHMEHPVGKFMKSGPDFYIDTKRLICFNVFKAVF